MTKPVYAINAPDQPRLKLARAEIEAILKKHDLAGVVVLHTPGMIEYFYNIDTSYSCCRIDEAARTMRVKSKLADYDGNAELQLHDQAATANMMAGLVSGLRNAANTFEQCQHAVDAATRAQHTPPVFRPDPNEANQH